ncbi:hypothetical protein [Bifidobacterium rousetti]|uniref:hypothetical protein n=1 Tax=Bifidobacterium rousetti TaxID=2045439 RepID=UPI00168BCC3F|nr:hypothetical protein [Bifidobacterium rousetti]
MIAAQMKKVADAGTPTTCKNNPGPTTDLNCTEIVASTLLILAFLLVFTAYGFAELEPLKALISASIALLLLAFREGVVRVDEAWNQRMTAWRELHSRELDGEEVGRYRQGDGTPRTAGGKPFEPLTGWEKVKRV